MIKLRIPVRNGPYVGETVWATPLANGNFRLENEPLCEFLNYRDIVKASMVDGMFEYRSLVIRGQIIKPDDNVGHLRHR